jgi:hypothetical protein
MVLMDEKMRGCFEALACALQDARKQRCGDGAPSWQHALRRCLCVALPQSSIARYLVFAACSGMVIW